MKDQKIKREDGNIYSWVLTLIFMAWNVFWFSIWAHEDFYFRLDGATAVGTLVVSAFTAAGIAILRMTVYGTEYIKTTEFTIFQFQLWDKKNARYVTKYDYGSTELHAKFLFHWQVSTITRKWGAEDIERNYSQSRYFDEVIGYTKEDVMKMIKKWALAQIENNKKVENVRIINITTLETIKVEDLINSLENGTQPESSDSEK